MNKKLLIRIFISSIIGIILGVLTELILIYNYTSIFALITQSMGFWLIVILLGVLFSSNIKEAILTNAFILNFMSISYYIVRFINNGYSLIWYKIKFYLFWCTIGSIIISSMLKLPKKGKYISIFSYLIIIIYFIYFYIIDRFNQGAWLFTRKLNYNTYIFVAIIGIIISIISIIKQISSLKKEKISRNQKNN